MVCSEVLSDVIGSCGYPRDVGKSVGGVEKNLHMGSKLYHYSSVILYTFACMLPVLIDLPYLKIYTFGVFLLLSFFWSSFLLWKTILLTSYKEEQVFDSLFLSLVVGVIVSRLVHVITHFSDFGFSVSKFIFINGYPGLSLYGFIFGSLLGLFMYAYTHKLKSLEYIDYFVPSTFVALGFGKIGSFFSGVDVGVRTSFPLAIKYVGFDGLRHIPALYEGILFFLAAFVAYQTVFAIRRGTYQKGTNLVFFFFIYSLVTLIFDLLKERTTTIFGKWSLNASLSIVLLLTFTFLFLYYFRGFFSKFLTNHGKIFNKRVHKKTERKTS